MNISPTGSWLCETREPHGFDSHLAEAILKFLLDNHITSVKDFGCGSGAYVDFLNNHGIWCIGYDGNPSTPHFSPRCHHLDLSAPVEVGSAECVISLEVGEHIPAQYEEAFITNLTKHTEKFLILSWFPNKGEGIGHVNERSNDYVREKIEAWGFEFMPDVTKQLRESSKLWWFSLSVLVFKKK